MIHNTRRKTQPWKAGLPVDFVPAENNPYNPVMLLMRLRRKLFGTYALLGKYKAPPRSAPGATLLLAPEGSPCRRASSIRISSKEHMRENHVRHDAFEVLERTPPLEQVLPKAA